MKVVLIFGNGAVGKMTVGQELMKITDLRLFHNHMTIEPVLEVFGEYNSYVINKLRKTIFEEFAKSNKYGLIFTFIWAFDSKADWDFVSDLKRIFEPYNTEFYYVELVASQDERLKRNISENRLQNKVSKRNIEASNKIILEYDQKYRLESYDGEIPFEHCIKIDNTNISAEAVAETIKDRFKL
jgi:hypothetical protein